MNLEPFIDSELTAVKLFLDEVPSFLAAKAAEVANDNEGPYTAPLLTTRQAYEVARQLSLEAMLSQLNAIVDGCLLVLANRVRNAAPTWKDMNRPRSALVKELEATFSTKAGLHPGWEQVEFLREEVNAIKHRMGFIFGVGEFSPLGIEKDVKPTHDLVMERFLGVRAWLGSFSRLVAATGK